MDLSSIKTYVGRDWELVQERIGNVLCSDIDLLNVTNGTVLSHSASSLGHFFPFLWPGLAQVA